MGGLFAVGSALSLFPWLSSCTKEGAKEIEGQVARLGIIGTGSRGQFHIANLLVDKSAKIVALCDDYEPHLQQAAALCPQAKLYSDYHRLLEDKEVDAVVICTPLNLHAPITIDSFDAGKNVFCEKSLAYSIDQCKEVIAKWQSSGKVFVVGQQRLFDPKYIKAMELIHSGAIGEVVGVRNYWYRNNDWRRECPSPEFEKRINWRLYNQSSRGLMTELACHQLQNGSWAMGQYPQCVTGMGSIRYWKDSREVFDNVSVIYEYPNGVHMTFESIISNKHFGMGEFILGSKGTIDLVKGIMYSEDPAKKSGIEQFLIQIEQGILSNQAFAGSSWSQESGSTDPGIRFTDKVITTDGSSSVGATADGSVELMHAFCHGVITGRQPETIIKEAYYATALALLGDQASHEKSTIYLKEEDRIL